MKRISPLLTELIYGLVPIVDINFPVFTRGRTPLASAEVVLVGNVDLNAGDVIGVFYLRDGLGFNLNIQGSPSVPGAVWSVNSLF